MQTAMFMEEPKQDNRSIVHGSIHNAHAALLDEVANLLKDNHYSAHELYELLIHKGLLRPAHFKDFQKFLRWAIRDGYLNKNKLISRTIGGVRLPNRFTKEQLITYFKTCTDARVAVASFLGVWSGLRIGDVIKLKVEDFDFEREIVKVVQSKRSKDRIAPFLREAEKIIKLWIQYAGATDYLFPSPEVHSLSGDPYVSRRTVSNGFDIVIKKTNLQRFDERYPMKEQKRKKFTFHSFRHTFCTYHLENEVSAAFVSRAAGHSKMDTTVGVYGHMATGNMIKAFRRSFQSKAKVEVPKVKKQDVGPLQELAQKFISGEISEDVFKRKSEVLAGVGF